MKEEENAMTQIAELEKALENVKSILNRIGCRAAVRAHECECGPDAISFRSILQDSEDAARICKSAVRNCKRIVRMSDEEKKRFSELKAENTRLRKALQEIAVFASEEYLNRGLSPSCLPFMTISRHAEKALKGGEV